MTKLQSKKIVIFLKSFQILNVRIFMKPIYSTGDKVYLTEEDDFVDYEIVEINSVDGDHDIDAKEYFTYKIKPVTGNKTIVKSESEIFPITG